MKIRILGGPGSGKTSTAQWLAKESGLPFYELDDFLMPGGEVRPDRQAPLKDILALPAWIVIGRQFREPEVLPFFQQADLIIYLDPGVWACDRRLMGRTLTGGAKESARVKELLDWNHKREPREKQQALSMLKCYGSRLEVCRNHKEVEAAITKRIPQVAPPAPVLQKPMPLEADAAVAVEGPSVVMQPDVLPTLAPPVEESVVMEPEDEGSSASLRQDLIAEIGTTPGIGQDDEDYLPPVSDGNPYDPAAVPSVNASAIDMLLKGHGTPLEAGETARPIDRMPTIQNEELLVRVDRHWPRLLSITRLSDNLEIPCCDFLQPFSIELNGELYDADHVIVSQVVESRAVDYTVRITSLKLTMRYRFALEGSEILLTMPEVVERGEFRLEQVFIPDHRLVTGTAVEGYQFLRQAARRASWSREWCPGTPTYDVWEERGAVGGCPADPGPLPTQHVCLWNDKVAIAIRSSIHVAPLVTQTFRAGSVAEERAGSFSLWLGPYAYRLRGKLAEPLEVRIAVLGDYNRDGKVDWADAAAWEGDRTVKPNPLYHEALVYKLLLDMPGAPTPIRTFDRCLEDIRRAHDLSGGMKQIVYLVGWQHKGHDTDYPSHARVNERLGGVEGLRRLIAAAEAYHCTVSLHGNFDDSYASSPEYREELLSRDTAGRKAVWFYNRLVDEPVYSINHTLAVESGYAEDRIERLLAMVPIRESIHLDAHRPYSESLDAQGRLIRAEEEVQIGMATIKRLLANCGVDITTEDTDSEKRGLYSWTWILPDWRLAYSTVMYHGRQQGVWRQGLKSGRGNLHPAVEGEALGLAFFRTEEGHDSYESMQRHFYLHWMHAQLLFRKKMTGLQVGHWNNGVVARYADETWTRGDEAGLVTWYEGIPAARGADRFLPWRQNIIYAYSVEGGAVEWTLPAAWEGGQILAETLKRGGVDPGPALEVEGRSVRFEAPVDKPVRLTLTSGA